VDSRGIGRKKQLLPDVFAAPVCDAVKQCMQDFVPSLVICRLSLPVQLRDHVGRRIEVVQNWVGAGNCLELGSACLCA
jgi:hypothetical protein